MPQDTQPLSSSLTYGIHVAGPVKFMFNGHPQDIDGRTWTLLLDIILAEHFCGMFVCCHLLQLA